MKFQVLIAAAAVFAMPVIGSAASKVEITIPEAGSISREIGLEAWQRVYEVVSHPRCANCHVGADGVPMWSGPSYGKTRPHGMNIKGGETRIGAETIPCETCHAYRGSGGNDAPHMPPQVAMGWALAPAEADWFGRTSQEICLQLRNPDLNGGRDYVELAQHLDHDLILHWAWTPGGGREPAPYSLQEHVNDVLAWGAAGQPCPEGEE